MLFPSSERLQVLDVPADAVFNGCDASLCQAICLGVVGGGTVADQLFQEIADCALFSKIDKRCGFFQLLLDKDTQDLTSFWWNGTLYRFKQAPFG